MKRVALLVGLVCVAGPAAAAECGQGSPLAMLLLRCAPSATTPIDAGSFATTTPAESGAPELWLAQRVIDREWNAPTDTSATARMVGGRSEGAALLLSGLVPGAGQLYVGERSGYLFAALETIGWVGWWLLRRKADDLREDAQVVAGVPSDPASGWSFRRWQTATGGDSVELQRLYDLDREAFYDAIADDDRYAAGWSSSDTHGHFGDLRTRSDHRLRTAHRTETALWLNHLVAAADGLRAARFHNIPLQRGLELKASGRWRSSGPMLALAIERRF